MTAWSLLKRLLKRWKKTTPRADVTFGTWRILANQDEEQIMKTVDDRLIHPHLIVIDHQEMTAGYYLMSLHEEGQTTPRVRKVWGSATQERLFMEALRDTFFPAKKEEDTHDTV